MSRPAPGPIAVPASTPETITHVDLTGRALRLVSQDQQCAICIEVLVGRISRSGGAPGTPSAWATPPAPLPRRLVLNGGFTVIDGQQRHLQRQARRLGFADLGGCLHAQRQHAAQQRAADRVAKLGVDSARTWWTGGSPRHAP